MKKPVKVVVDGVEKKYFIAKPGAKQESQAKLESNKKFREALGSQAYFREELNKVLIERGIWTEAEDKQLQEYQEKIAENIRILDEEGGIELEEAKKLAMETRKYRLAQILLSHKLREHDAYTVEGQCDNAYFDTLVALCSYDEEGNRLFKSYEDYLDKAGEEYAVACAKELSKLLYGLEDNWEKELPENKFLIEYKFVDEDLNYIDSQGRKVDSEGRLIDDNGRYINEEGKFIDIHGNLVDENGKKVKEKKPFLVNGNPV